jgi:hypothetical protein
MPNLDPWLKQSKYDQRINKAECTTLEKHLLSIRSHNQKQIKPNCHPTYNEDHEKRIELIDWVLKKYKDDLSLKKEINQQQD